MTGMDDEDRLRRARILKADVFRLRSIDRLTRLGCRVLPPSHLPKIEQRNWIKSVDEIARRLQCLQVVVLVGFGADRLRARKILEECGLSSFLTKEEYNRVFGDSAVQDVRTNHDLVEAMFALAWVFAMVESIDLMTTVPNDLATLLPRPSDVAAVASLKSHARRNLEEVHDALDLYYCAHWSYREGGFGFEPTDISVHPSIIVNRRLALEWCLSVESWDEVSLDT